LSPKERIIIPFLLKKPARLRKINLSFTSDPIATGIVRQIAKAPPGSI